MKLACFISIGLALVAGFLAGRLTAPEPVVTPSAGPDPKAALSELLRYRGEGARAQRHITPLLDAIVSGGEGMLPEIADALEAGGDRDYHLQPDFDTDRYVLARPATRRMALLDAVDRIGGEEALPILLGIAGSKTADSLERTVAALFLARRGDRPEVREFFADQLRKHLANFKEDGEMMWFLRISRDHLDAAVFDDLMKAFLDGWPKAVDPQSVYAEIGESLAALDEPRAREVFLGLIGDGSAKLKARAAAAMSIARIPDARPRALEMLLEDENQNLLGFFVKGGKHGRFGEPYMIRNADEAQDPKVRVEFLEEWLERKRQFATQLDEIAARARPEIPPKIDLAENRQWLKRQIAEAERRLDYERKQAGK